MSRSSILVVDDSSTVRVRLRRILTNAGYDVALAENGRQGVRRVQELCPDLIILDIQMPDIDGYAVCEELQRSGEPWASLPVIFLTSLESHALTLLGSKMGAYLQKPIRPEDLLNAVKALLAQPRLVPGPQTTPRETQLQ
jgi:DNA-binding response OmpR family regulator